MTDRTAVNAKQARVIVARLFTTDKDDTGRYDIGTHQIDGGYQSNRTNPKRVGAALMVEVEDSDESNCEQFLDMIISSGGINFFNENGSTFISLDTILNLCAAETKTHEK